ncbi:hypothetical protein J3F83DRAFT_187498 [Trichoderma novae-zelandiae]
MNWTGGNLSRHRRGKGWKEELARQKEYFAKARSRQREQKKSEPPFTLSAADFIPNYTYPPEPPTSLYGAEASPSPSVLCGKPVSAAAKVSTSLGARPTSLPRDVTELGIGKIDGPLLSDQTVKDRSVGASDPEAGYRRLLRRIDSAETEMPRLPELEPARREPHLTILRHTSERQQQLGRLSGHHKPSGVVRQRENRKWRLRQATPSPKSIRIRVGSQDYRWSESRNSIGIPTYGQRSQTQSTASEETRRRMRSTDVTSPSHLIAEFLTGSSSSSSHPALSSPCRSRASRLREFRDSTGQAAGATPTQIQRPLPDGASGPAPKSPPLAPSTSEVDSTDSIAVQASDDGLMPETETDEERIWRQWLG